MQWVGVQGILLAGHEREANFCKTSGSQLKKFGTAIPGRRNSMNKGTEIMMVEKLSGSVLDGQAYKGMAWA